MRGFRLSRHLRNAKPVFESHFGEKAILRGLADRTIVSGELVVSHHNNSKARIITDAKEKFACNGFVSRNRALSGDRVFARFIEDQPEVSSEDSSVPTDFSKLDDLAHVAGSKSDKSCRVVGIKERSGMRYVSRARPGEALVQPRDTRFPAMRPIPDIAVDSSSLAVVKFRDWETTQQYPDCDLVRLLGKEGSFDAEDDASLELNGLISDLYPVSIEETLRELFPSPEAVVARELGNRKDCRSERVFSIDPPTAKDLDDAVSVVKLADGTYRIGVHVADVSYFVQASSELDNQAKTRATSVYLPRKVYPMLPPYLSENLCSLLPGTDRLAFSVFFTLDEEARLVGEPEFVRSIIHSQLKLSYDDVDACVESIPSAIRDDIETLMRLTGKLRNSRIASGSVSLDDRNGQEIRFEFAQLGDGTCFPVQVKQEVNVRQSGGHDSHTLIEELMVLTNKLVADKLCQSSEITVPVLRRHLDTEEAVVLAASRFLIKAGISLPSDNVQLSELLRIARKELTSAQLSTFTHSILGEFSRAEYVVSPESAASAHWGVGTARYMHFTSPIRRYADLIVHRKLCQILGQVCQKTEEEDVIEQIKRCNANSKAAQEAESDNKLFYFSTFVASFGNHGYVTEAIVKQLIAPDGTRGVKGSVEFFLPVIGDSRSQSLDSLGLEIVEMTKTEDAVTSTVVKDLVGGVRELKLFQPITLRAYVKNPTAPVPKFHLRVDRVPLPPPRRKSPKRRHSKP